jgi:acetyl-CoA carboxylase biotin carboxylase subunit
MFKKILIANRGEIALRVIRTAREMGIKTVAVYSTADRESLHVRFADEAVCIGPPPSKESYLNMSRIIAAAEITNADAIHPGYGFLSENAKFSRICQEHGIKFIGALPEQIEAMGDKATAKSTMIAAGVPCVPGTEGLVTDLDVAKKEAIKIGYPVILKATAGGGGKGMRLVWKEEEFEEAFEKASQEAGAAFGNPGMYMEKYVLEPRHIEIQIAGDQYGTFCHMSERDCSIQRRHQKLVEETPSPFMTKTLRKKMGEAAIKAAASVNYEGVGTVEFLVDKDRNFYFMEMNTRIQVEHTITEEVIDFDLDTRADQDRFGHPHQRTQLRAHTTQHPVPHQRGRSVQRFPAQPRQDHQLPQPRWSWCAHRHARIRRLHHSTELRQHDRQGDR